MSERKCFTLRKLLLLKFFTAVWASDYDGADLQCQLEFDSNRRLKLKYMNENIQFIGVCRFRTIFCEQRYIKQLPNSHQTKEVQCQPPSFYVGTGERQGSFIINKIHPDVLSWKTKFACGSNQVDDVCQKSLTLAPSQPSNITIIPLPSLSELYVLHQHKNWERITLTINGTSDHQTRDWNCINYPVDNSSSYHTAYPVEARKFEKDGGFIYRCSASLPFGQAYNISAHVTAFGRNSTKASKLFLVLSAPLPPTKVTAMLDQRTEMNETVVVNLQVTLPPFSVQSHLIIRCHSDSDETCNNLTMTTLISEFTYQVQFLGVPGSQCNFSVQTVSMQKSGNNYISHQSTVSNSIIKKPLPPQHLDVTHSGNGESFAVHISWSDQRKGRRDFFKVKLCRGLEHCQVVLKEKEVNSKGVEHNWQTTLNLPVLDIKHYTIRVAAVSYNVQSIYIEKYFVIEPPKPTDLNTISRRTFFGYQVVVTWRTDGPSKKFQIGFCQPDVKCFKHRTLVVKSYRWRTFKYILNFRRTLSAGSYYVNVTNVVETVKSNTTVSDKIEIEYHRCTIKSEDTRRRLRSYQSTNIPTSVVERVNYNMFCGLKSTAVATLGTEAVWRCERGVWVAKAKCLEKKQQKKRPSIKLEAVEGVLILMWTRVTCLAIALMSSAVFAIQIYNLNKE